jgi:hypothetical protein
MLWDKELRTRHQSFRKLSEDYWGGNNVANHYVQGVCGDFFITDKSLSHRFLLLPK